jgi:transcriptional regulator with XRE-family HTH domain
MDNKDIFSSNLKRYMEENGKTRKDVSEAIGVSYFTFTDWVNGKKFPRMDKVEKLAEYFGILKSDLIEKRNPERESMQKKNDTLSDIILRMRTDDEFLSACESLYKLDNEKLRRVCALLDAFVE